MNTRCSIRNIVYDRIEEDSKQSTKNLLVAHGSIDNNYNILDMTKFISDNKDLSQKASDLLKDNVTLYTRDKDRALVNDSVFTRIDKFKLNSNQSNIQYQKLTAEEKSKTIEQITKEHRSITALKDLAYKLAYRIGGKVEFINDSSLNYKGFAKGLNATYNEAWMDSSTIFHEALGHPIIGALKSLSKQKESVSLQEMLDKNIIEKKCN